MGGILFIALIDVVLTQKSTSYLNPEKISVYMKMLIS